MVKSLANSVYFKVHINAMLVNLEPFRLGSQTFLLFKTLGTKPLITSSSNKPNERSNCDQIFPVFVTETKSVALSKYLANYV